MSLHVLDKSRTRPLSNDYSDLAYRRFGVLLLTISSIFSIWFFYRLLSFLLS